MGRLRLGHFIVRLGLSGMDNVRELDGILNEEDGDVVADKVPVALLSVEFDGKATHVACRIHATAAPQDRREANKNRRLPRRIGQDWREGEVVDAVINSELAKGAGASGVDYSLGDPFVVKSHDLRQLAPASPQI